MGLFSTLGKLGAGIAAPFTGGASLALLPAIDAVGGVLGGGASAAAGGRRDDAMLQAQMNQGNNRAQLDAAQFNLTAPDQRMQQLLRAEFLGKMRNAPSTGDARIDKFSGGGLRPELLQGESSMQGADAMKRQALQALLSGSDRVTPQMSTLPKSGLMEKIGAGAGLLGGVLGALGESGVMRQKPAQMPPAPFPTSAYGNVRF